MEETVRKVLQPWHLVKSPVAAFTGGTLVTPRTLAFFYACGREAGVHSDRDVQHDGLQEGLLHVPDPAVIVFHFFQLH